MFAWTNIIVFSGSCNYLTSSQRAAMTDTELLNLAGHEVCCVQVAPQKRQLKRSLWGQQIDVSAQEWNFSLGWLVIVIRSP